MEFPTAGIPLLNPPTHQKKYIKKRERRIDSMKHVYSQPTRLINLDSIL